MNNRKVSGETLTTQKDNGQFNDPRFQLRTGFAGTHEVLDVTDVKNREDEVYSHRVTTKSAMGVNSLFGGVIGRAILVKDIGALGKIATVKEGVKNIWYEDTVAHLSNKSFHHAYKKDKNGDFTDFEYPENIEVLGAAVFHAKVGEHPQVALNKYPMYGILNRHHKALHDTFMTWSDALNYAEATGDARPKGLPKDFKLELPNEAAAWESSNWTFRLIIKDLDA